jgi:hypothetical protein
MDHSFFFGVDWDDMHLRDAPWNPSQLINPPNLNDILEDARSAEPLSEAEQMRFQKWDENVVITHENEHIWRPDWKPGGDGGSKVAKSKIVSQSTSASAVPNVTASAEPGTSYHGVSGTSSPHSSYPTTPSSISVNIQMRDCFSPLPRYKHETDTPREMRDSPFMRYKHEADIPREMRDFPFMNWKHEADIPRKMRDSPFMKYKREARDSPLVKYKHETDIPREKRDAVKAPSSRGASVHCAALD